MPYKDPQQKATYNERYQREHREELRSYHREYMRDYRQEMNESRKAQIRKQNRLKKMEKRREMASLILMERDKPCVDCGLRLPPECMEFDHVRDIKLFSIAGWENARLGSVDRKQAVLNEIAKCDVRCPNCHRLRHYHERSQ